MKQDYVFNDVTITVTISGTPVAWRIFDGENSYTYMCYEGNENFKEKYIKRNGEKYSNWIQPLYLKNF